MPFSVFLSFEFSFSRCHLRQSLESAECASSQLAHLGTHTSIMSRTATLGTSRNSSHAVINVSLCKLSMCEASFNMTRTTVDNVPQ